MNARTDRDDGSERSTCGHGIPADAPGGLCPRCALAGALQDGGTAQLQDVGAYEIEDLIARGGMGAVYRARHKSLGRTVALKMLVGGIWADDDERARFRAEAELAASLEHENIVPIYEVGEHDGQPYYAMRLMHESLAAYGERVGRVPPIAAAALVATVARAIHHGHLRGVVHRDLKPENILLDETGRPFVGDFGVSRRLGQSPRDRRRTASGVIVGTPGYMAPEQAGAFGGDITTATDVWGLGAVLYALLCGEPPIAGDTPAAVLKKLLDEEPVRPRTVRPDIDVDLETVCLKCLEKQPERRYPSALELAADLERIVRGEPIHARRQTGIERVLRFCRRHPGRAAAVASAVVFLAALAVGSTLAARVQERELREETLQTNAWVARAVAGAVHSEMQQLGDIVARASQDEALVLALQRGTPLVYAPPLAQPFDSFLLLDDDGVCLARWPPSPELIGRDLSFRDYARLAQGAARGMAVVAPAYRSEADGSLRFAVAAPIFVDERRVGALVGSLASDSTLGALSLRQEAGFDSTLRTVILLSRHGAEPGGAGTVNDNDDDDWIVLVHPALPESGDTVVVPARALQGLLRDAFDDSYRDPLTTDAALLAGLARVGDLPFAVVVETPASLAVAQSARWMRRVVSAGSLAGAIGIIVFFGGFMLARPRRRPTASARV